MVVVVVVVAAKWWNAKLLTVAKLSLDWLEVCPEQLEGVHAINTGARDFGRW